MKIAQRCALDSARRNLKKTPLQTSLRGSPVIENSDGKLDYEIKIVKPKEIFVFGLVFVFFKFFSVFLANFGKIL